jgi:hypothetical protein
MERVV